jgi:hypothetical protein
VSTRAWIFFAIALLSGVALIHTGRARSLQAKLARVESLKKQSLLLSNSESGLREKTFRQNQKEPRRPTGLPWPTSPWSGPRPLYVQKSDSESPNRAQQAAIELDRETREDLSSLFSSEEIEKDFLLNEVKITDQQYLDIQNQRKQVQSELAYVESWAKSFGVDPEELKKPILEKHIYWMQSSIGVGYYNQLQELASAEF